MAAGTPTNAAIVARFAGVQQADGADRPWRAGPDRLCRSCGAGRAGGDGAPGSAGRDAAAAGRLAGAVVVVEAIKLIESGLDQDCDEVLVVAATEETQLQRLMDRRGMSFAEAERRILGAAASGRKAGARQPCGGQQRRVDRHLAAGGGALARPGRPAAACRNQGPGHDCHGLCGWPAAARVASVLIYGAILAAFFGVWVAINWINAGFSAGQKAAVLTLCLLTAGACAWVVARW